MANPRRTQRVSQQIMREVSLLMLSDKRVRCAPPSVLTSLPMADALRYATAL
jgi:hypothetical protein